MNAELILCIPGPWKDRSDFLRQVVTLEPQGEFIFAGGILAHVAAKDHVQVEFTPADPQLLQAFELAGQGRLSPETLAAIAAHQSVVFLVFPIDIEAQRTRLIKFSTVLRRLGGSAVKVESAGTAHEWERWLALLGGSTFDLYCAAVVLIGGADYFYSCGMHHFGLPECAVPTDIGAAEAADLMNRYNYWQIVERPTLQSGHTFSLAADAPRYRLDLRADARHESDHPFFNPHGIWHLEPVRG